MQKDRGSVPTTWSKGTLMHREISVTTEVKERVRSLLQIEVNYHNWSLLLNLNRPSTPPIVPWTREEVDCVPVIETVVEKDGPGSSAVLPQRASSSRQGPKPRPEKRLHRAEPSKKVAPEPSVQPNEEEKAEFTLVHRKRKVSV